MLLVITYGFCIRVQIRGRSCAVDFDRYKTQSIGCATAKFDAWYLFAATKYRTQFNLTRKKSKYALQKPMHLKLQNS
jgi:hypothetical protein